MTDYPALMRARAVLVSHHQPFNEAGVEEGIWKPTAGKQFEAVEASPAETVKLVNGEMIWICPRACVAPSNREARRGIVDNIVEGVCRRKVDEWK